jgi:hypothetical protein
MAATSGCEGLAAGRCMAACVGGKQLLISAVWLMISAVCCCCFLTASCEPYLALQQ